MSLRDIPDLDNRGHRTPIKNRNGESIEPKASYGLWAIRFRRAVYKQSLWIIIIHKLWYKCTALCVRIRQRHTAVCARTVDVRRGGISTRSTAWGICRRVIGRSPISGSKLIIRWQHGCCQCIQLMYVRRYSDEKPRKPRKKRTNIVPDGIKTGLYLCSPILQYVPRYLCSTLICFLVPVFPGTCLVSPVAGHLKLFVICIASWRPFWNYAPKR